MQKVLQRMCTVTHYRLNDPDNQGKLMADPNAKLEEELIVCPTSKAIIWSNIQRLGSITEISLLLINQWQTLFVKMRTRLFLQKQKFMARRSHCTCYKSRRSCRRIRKNDARLRRFCRKTLWQYLY
jgi:hypothetical protein